MTDQAQAQTRERAIFDALTERCDWIDFTGIARCAEEAVAAWESHIPRERAGDVAGRLDALEAVAHPPVGFELCGYFRFIESDTPGVIGEVVSIYKEGYAEDSSVPVYRIRGETKVSLRPRELSAPSDEEIDASPNPEKGARTSSWHSRPSSPESKADSQGGAGDRGATGVPHDPDSVTCAECDGVGGVLVDSMTLYGIPGGEDWACCEACKGTGLAPNDGSGTPEP